MMKKCPKCKMTSGNDWTQCGSNCPIEMSPYYKTNTNSTVDDRERRQDLKCSYCPPNKGDNTKNYAKYGKTKPKYKNKRK